jgi:hypothetical protein
MEMTPSEAELKKLQLFLYKIRLDEADGWVKNANEHNQIKTEWKTKSTIDKNIVGKEQIDLVKWLSTKKLVLLGGGKADANVGNTLMMW